MLNRRRVAAFALSAVFALPVWAQAMESKPFDMKAFEAAQAAGQPILIDVTAPWCPTCKVQKPILSQLTAKPKFKDLTVFEIDFDSRKDVLRTLKVQQQSTLIAYKGKREVGRSTGDTNPTSIEDLLNKSI